MRIAYLSLHWPRTRTNSIGKKIQRSLRAWQSAGHETCLFMHTTRYEPEQDLLPGEVFYYGGAARLKLELSRISAARRLLDSLAAFQPDIIHLRYGIYVYPLQHLSGIAPLVEDVTANDLIQHEELGPLYATYNRLTRGLLLSRTSGLISVSQELADSPVFSVYKKPTLVLANGINIQDFEPFPAPDNKQPRLIFIGTPSAGFAAHGLDKLVPLADQCRDLEIDVIGYDALPGGQAAPGNIHFHGYLPEERYKLLLAQADVALSSLAFHRVGLMEASPLKSREYLAYGLPMVVPYVDTDLDDLDCDFLLKIPNREDNIETHAPAIREFAYRMRGKRVDRAMIANRIDSRSKERERLKFFERILQDAR